MTEECLAPQDICDLYTGDKFPFEFDFDQPDGSPLNISNMTIVLYMYIYDESEFPTGENIPPTPGTNIYNKGESLRKVVLFPEDQDSIDGIGYMVLLPSETSQLQEDKTYNYKFRLENSPEEIFTVGVGQIKTN